MSFIKKLTSQKPAPTTTFETKFRQITCLAGGGVALVAMVLLLIALAGYDAVYVWSSIAVGICPAVFFGLAFLRYMMPSNRLVGRLSDASVWLVLFGLYTAIELIVVRVAVSENGSIVTAWVTFGLVAFFSAFFLIAALASTRKFRLFGSFAFLLMTFAPLFGIVDLIRSFFFAPALVVILLVLAMAAFAASPVIFWFFDKYNWQMKVFYILMAAGTLCSVLIPVLYAFAGR